MPTATASWGFAIFQFTEEVNLDLGEDQFSVVGAPSRQAGWLAGMDFRVETR